MQFDEVSLRACALKDAGALAIIGAATFLETFAGVLDGDSILAHCQRQHSVELYTTYLAQPETHAWLAGVQPGDAPVGYAMISEPDLPSIETAQDDIELKRIYLFTRFQRLGAGKLLFEQALSAARMNGKRRLLLGVFAGNAGALKFYRKNGFEVLGARTFQVGAMICDDLILGRSV